MNKRLLVVDDSFTIRKVIEMLIASTNHTAVYAVDTVGALSLAQTGDIDLAVVDFGMLAETGVPLSAQMKQDFPGIPILLMVNGRDDISGIPPSIFDDIIEKPFDTQSFISKLENIELKTAGSVPEGTIEVQPVTEDIVEQSSGDTWDDLDIGLELEVSTSTPDIQAEPLAETPSIEDDWSSLMNDEEPAPMTESTPVTPDIPSDVQSDTVQVESSAASIVDEDDLFELDELDEVETVPAYDEPKSEAEPDTVEASPDISTYEFGLDDSGYGLIDQIAMDTMSASQETRQPEQTSSQRHEEGKVNLDELFSDLNDILVDESGPKEEVWESDDLIGSHTEADIEEEKAQEVAKVMPFLEEAAKEFAEIEMAGSVPNTGCSDVWKFDIEKPRPVAQQISDATVTAVTNMTLSEIDKAGIEALIKDIAHDVIEKIAWEVVPEIIETVMRDKNK